jgi:ArsR family transcriptional regulator
MAVDTSPCCSPRLSAHLEPERADAVAALARALADPVRVQILGVLRDHDEDVCQCELQPLFDVSQPTLSHHLRKLGDAGLVRTERRGRWAWYSIEPGALEELRRWLS